MFYSNLEVVGRLVMRSFLVLTSSPVLCTNKKFWSVDALRHYLLTSSCRSDSDDPSLITNLDISTTLPSKDCLIEHIKRANYQVRIWRVDNFWHSKTMGRTWLDNQWRTHLGFIRHNYDTITCWYPWHCDYKWFNKMMMVIPVVILTMKDIILFGWRHWQWLRFLWLTEWYCIFSYILQFFFKRLFNLLLDLSNNCWVVILDPKNLHLDIKIVTIS